MNSRKLAAMFKADSSGKMKFFPSSGMLTAITLIWLFSVWCLVYAQTNEYTEPFFQNKYFFTT
jgi:hypothetical protein